MGCNEKNYIKRLKKKKEDALEYIVDKYLSLVKGVTYKVLSPLNNEGIIEECINDVFLSVWNNADKFKGEDEDFRKWICKVAKFRAIDYYRKEAKKYEISQLNDNQQGTNLVEEELIGQENIEELVKLINTLDEKDREIFMMKFFLDMKSNEIATKLDITKASVDNRISRGRKKLKDRIDDFRMGVI